MMLRYNPPLGSIEISVKIEGTPEDVLAFLARGRNDSLVREATVTVAVKPDRKRMRFRDAYVLPKIKTVNVREQQELVQKNAQQIGLEHVQSVVNAVNQLALHFDEKPRD